MAIQSISWQKSSWCVRSQSKYWQNMQFQTQVKRYIHQKGAEKLVKDALWAITKFQIFNGRYLFRFGYLLRQVNALTFDTEEYYPRCYKAN